MTPEAVKHADQELVEAFGACHPVGLPDQRRLVEEHEVSLEYGSHVRCEARESEGEGRVPVFRLHELRSETLPTRLSHALLKALEKTS